MANLLWSILNINCPVRYGSDAITYLNALLRVARASTLWAISLPHRPLQAAPLPPRTVKTSDVEFRTYNRMTQDQTVHWAEYVSG